MLPELTYRFLKEWDIFFPNMDKPKTIDYLSIPGSIIGGTTTFLAFGDSNEMPLFGVKICRNNLTKEKLLNERDMLNYLKTCAEIADSIPQVILCEKISGVWVLVESILEGYPMLATITEEGIPKIEEAEKNISLATNWLVQLHVATCDKTYETQNFLKHNAQKIIVEFANIFDLSFIEQDFLRKVANMFNSYDFYQGVVQHGDFCCQNLLISKKYNKVKIGVIDWTDSKRFGFPLHDLFFFLTGYYLQVRKYSGIKGFIKIFEDTFLNENPYSKIVKRYIKEYCSRVGIDFSQIRFLFAMFLIERAVYESQKIMWYIRRGELPRFTLHLASLDNINYHNAMQIQVWIHFYKEFVKKWKDLKIY